ncbi:gliding motility lipoprotein GldB [Flavobacteriaceae bacterium]|nr:gliding motility lipoprotein GldB [Flavobacteriaceae bacterium]
MFQGYLLSNNIKKIGIFLFLFICFSCNKKAQLEKEIAATPIEITVERFDQAFMQTAKENLGSLKQQYPFLFPKKTPDSVFLERTQDPIQKMIQKSVDSVFSDFQDTELELKSLYKHLKYYNPSLKTPRIITVYSDVDYRNKVIVTDSIVIISIDNYLGAQHEFYDSFYKYIKNNLKKDQIVMDLADAYASRLINQPKRNTFLEELIYHGKKLYLKDLWVPTAKDHTKIGYTQEELLWADDNAFYIWQYFVENELLYSTDTKLVGRFIARAPFSRFNLELDSESPGGLGQYIGWQIVRSYMENNPTSLPQMLQMNAQTLFNKAKYKPKK